MQLRAYSFLSLSGLLIAASCAMGAGPFSVELDGFASFSTISPYSDATTLFDPWVQVDNPDTVIPTNQLSLDNYPLLGSTAQSTSFLRAYPGWNQGTPDNRPIINYQVTWDGGGVDATNQPIDNVSFVNRPLTNFTSTIVDGVRKNTATLAFQYDGPTGQGSIALRIDNSLAGTTTAVSNLHLIPTQYIDPNTGVAPLFREDFLRKISPFKVLRFMDWQQANTGGLPDLVNPPTPFNDPRVVDWTYANADPANNQNVQGRASTTMFARTGIKGVPYEEIIALANASKKDIWINIPDRATTNYVNSLGQLLKDTLDPTVNVYVEFSNELWNTTGNQRWQRVLQDALLDTGGDHPVIDGTDPNNNLRTIYREAAKKVTDFGTILQTQLGPAAASRIKPVLAGQTPAPQLLQYGLEYLASQKGVAPGTGVDLSGVLGGIAVAPYVGNDLGAAELVKTIPNGTPIKLANGQPALDSTGQPLLGPDPDGKAQSLDQTQAEQTRYLNWLFPTLETYIESKLRFDIRSEKLLADKYHLPLLSYEGGQHLIAFNGTYGADLNGDFKVAANRDPRMGMLFKELTDMWSQETGAQLFNQFSLTSPYSSFGSWGLTEDLLQTSSPKWDALLSELAGDANLDGKVDFNDFQILEAHFNKNHAMWGDADFNLDGVVDYNDFLIFRGKFLPTGASPVQAEMVEAFALSAPEPGTLSLLALSMCAMLRRRKRN